MEHLFDHVSMRTRTRRCCATSTPNRYYTVYGDDVDHGVRRPERGQAVSGGGERRRSTALIGNYPLDHDRYGADRVPAHALRGPLQLRVDREDVASVDPDTKVVRVR